MKAIRKSDGKQINVLPYFEYITNSQRKRLRGYVDDEQEYRPDEIKIIPDKQPNDDKQIDWEQRRYEIARDYLLGRLAKVDALSLETLFKNAVFIADELIKQLKGE